MAVLFDQNWRHRILMLSLMAVLAKKVIKMIISLMNYPFIILIIFTDLFSTANKIFRKNRNYIWSWFDIDFTRKLYNDTSKFVILTWNVYKSCQNLGFTHQTVSMFIRLTRCKRKYLWMLVFFANLVYPILIKCLIPIQRYIHKKMTHQDTCSHRQVKYLTQI